MAGIPFGKYELVKRLARGGMAEVFLARQSGPEGFHRRVAVKRILPHLVDSQDFVRMFLDEARLAAQLSHPNVVHIYDFGKVDEHYFIAMEYVESVHAGTLIKHAEKDRMPDVLVARLGADACSGLNYAHELRDPDGRPLWIVHRDVSPPNLLVSYDGSVKLVDFGIAKAVSCVEQTRPGVVKGKFAYMSPEQTVGQKLDGRSDVFSLAVVLWELLAGKILVPRSDPVDGMRMLRDGRFPPIEKERPDVPPQLAAAIGRALRIKAVERATALELGLALEEFIKASQDGIGSSLELAAWLRERFPRENLSGAQQVVEPAGTRQATHATRAGVTGGERGLALSSGNTGALSGMNSSLAGASWIAGANSLAGASGLSGAVAPARTDPGAASAQATRLPSNSIIVASEWMDADEDEDQDQVDVTLDRGHRRAASAEDDGVGDENRPSFANRENGPDDHSLTMPSVVSESDITRIVTHPGGGVFPDPTGTTRPARSARRRSGVALLAALGATAGFVGAVALSNGGSDAHSVAPADPVQAVEPPQVTTDAGSARSPAVAVVATTAPDASPPAAGDPAVLDILTRPAGARVELGDRVDPGSPAHFDAVAPGTYELRVTLRGHQPQTRQIDLAAGEHRSVELEMVPTKASTRAAQRHADKVAAQKLPGVLKVRTRPYSEVYVGDRRLGQTPFVTELDPGRYTLVFAHPGRPKQRKVITVKGGDTVKLDFALE